MNNKEIQASRMKGYFIQATKEILKSEGLKGVNVRSIAQKAGYSYATMYNYFSDTKELVFICVKDFQDECENYVKQKSKKTPQGIEKIRAIVKNYIGFFIQYPGIFELFYLEKMGDLGTKKPIAEMIYTFLDKLCIAEWDYCVSHKLIVSEKVEPLKEQLNYHVAGLLLFYLNRYCPNSYTEFMNKLEVQLDLIFGNKSSLIANQSINKNTDNTTISNSLLSINIG